MITKPTDFMHFHKGVFIYGERGNWFCDLLPDESFKTLKKVKYFIDTYKDALPDAGNKVDIGDFDNDTEYR